MRHTMRGGGKIASECVLTQSDFDVRLFFASRSIRSVNLAFDASLTGSKRCLNENIEVELFDVHQTSKEVTEIRNG